MDLNRIYKAIRLYEQQIVKDIAEVAVATGLTELIVKDTVITKVRYQSVYSDYINDTEKGTISTYEDKKPKKLATLEYSRKLSRYTYKLLANKIEIADVESFLCIDDVPENQAKQMLKDLEIELVKAARESQHATLTKIDSILALPSKWHIIDSNIVEVYPKPMLEDNAVIGTIYETNKSYLLPDDLLDTYLSYSYQVTKFVRGDQDHDLTHTEQSNVLLAKEFKKLVDKGLSHKEVAAICGAKTSRVKTALQYLGSRTAKQNEKRAEQATKVMLTEKDKADKAAAKKKAKV